MKNVCHNLGYTATFMPKPLFGDNGSGMHVHQSLWKDDSPLFYDENGYALLSETARHYIGGLLAHAPALLALCAPTTNSYRRLVPGFEAPGQPRLLGAQPLGHLPHPDATRAAPRRERVEFRAPDPTANPYLAFSALLMAGLDGIKRKLEPPAPIDEDLYELHDERKKSHQDGARLARRGGRGARGRPRLPARGRRVHPDVLETWITMKRTKDIAPVSLRPHPYEFFLYYDA